MGQYSGAHPQLCLSSLGILNSFIERGYTHTLPCTCFKHTIQLFGVCSWTQAAICTADVRILSFQQRETIHAEHVVPLVHNLSWALCNHVSSFYGHALLCFRKSKLYFNTRESESFVFSFTRKKEEPGLCKPIPDRSQPSTVARLLSFHLPRTVPSLAGT